MDMKNDVFADQPYGKIALKKIASTDPNFRLYEARWLGRGDRREVMEVTGAVFREATRGPNKGQLSVIVPNTSRAAYVTAEEMQAFES